MPDAQNAIGAAADAPPRPRRPRKKSFKSQLKLKRIRLAVKLHRPAELCFYLLLITGLMITEYTQVPWEVKRWAITVHIASAIILFPLTILLFYAAHRGNMVFSNKTFNGKTGRVIEILIIVMFLCGLWLLFVGEDRTEVGAIAHVVHLVTAIPLVGLMLWHSWRFSLMKRLLGGLGVVAGLFFMVGTAANETPPMRAESSGSLQLSTDGTTLYSANFEGGSVARIDRKTGQRLAEAVLGDEIRTVAHAPAEKLVDATDHVGETVYFLDEETLEIQAAAAVPGRPYGVVYDARHKLFWVTASEGGTLYGIEPDGEIRTRMTIAETPRGLALLPDGRLLITHSLLGTVSIFDATKLPLRLIKTVTLAESHDPTPTVSQGLPRVLDRIALSPDLKQAWLPHHLWNFDHPFQFQSIVFPTVSVLWLGKGEEQEIVSRRKQLFKQINIVESGNLQRIVSNPYDAAFSKDAGKVYVTMAGSEDLLVFDLTRAPPLTGPKDTNAGANASTVLALPGQNPRGLAVDGQDLYVQNAMSLDLSLIDTGGGGPFAQISVKTPKFATLVGDDPLAPQMRRGLRLFHLAKTAAFPKAPMAGDNWMSCASCHLDGFNYTNRFLFTSTKRDVAQNAVFGHGSLKGFIAGDVVAEYIRMIRNTQGGMGFDTRFPTPNTEPEKPPKEVVAMMEDLHRYVTSRGNLPGLSTWLQANDGEGQVHHSAWVNPAVCGTCHTRIFEEWSGSMHRLMGESNPYYIVAEDLAAKEEGEAFRAWCMGCHAPQQHLAGFKKTEGVSHLFETDGKSLFEELEEHAHAVDEGTGCLFCHRADRIQEIGQSAGGNASLIVSLDDRQTYPGEDSDWAVVRWLAERGIRAEPEEHYRSFTPATLKSQTFCSTCHEEFTPGVAAITTETYTEWLNSPFNDPDNPEVKRTCVDCHMHAEVAKIGTPVPGYPTDDGPLKKNYIAHHFVGAQYHLVGLRDPRRRQMSIDLLKTSAHVEASLGDKGQLVVRVTNVGAGHRLPTGVSDFRQLWLDVTVTDANSKTVLESGKLDAGGQLDPKARRFANAFADGDGHSVLLDFWKFRKMAEDTRIPAGGHRDETFALPADAAFPLEVEIRLMFRTFPQAITDEVRKRYPEMPPPQAVELNNLKKAFGKS